MRSALFDATQGLAAASDVSVKVCVGSEEERQKSRGAFLAAKALVVDATALATLFLARLEEEFRALHLPLVVTEGTLEDVRRADLLSHGRGEPIRRIARQGDDYGIVEISAEIVEKERARLEKFLELVTSKCSIAPGTVLAGLPKDKREGVTNVLGRATAESIALARERRGAIWSDDFVVGLVADSEVGCGRVWSQLVFEEEVAAGHLSEECFDRLTIQLLQYRYEYTWLTPRTVLAAGRSCNWRVADRAFEAVLEHFSNPAVHASGLVVLFLKVLAGLWGGGVLDEVAQAVTLRMATNVMRRADGIAVLRAIQANLRPAFGLNVLGEEKARQILKLLVNVGSREIG